ncbi:MAG: hypothetical protein P4M11_09405, partial [Candidatus Pacebacteria bacterium]|nr:hypothetical protein [Candidatus Paceibacterota bacterium]
MDAQLMELLERGVSAFERMATALERIAKGGSIPDTPVIEPRIDRVRDTMMSRFKGAYVSVTQARDALGMHESSSKEIGKLLTAAGFERRRWAQGVRFAICEPGGVCVGSPVTLPDNLDESMQAARVAQERTGRKPSPEGVLYGAYLMQGVTA